MADGNLLDELLEKCTEQRRKIKALIDRNEDLEHENRKLLEQVDELETEANRLYYNS